MSSKANAGDAPGHTSDERDVRAATDAQQHDFPYGRGDEAQVTRREFCNFLGLTSAALFVSAAGFAGKAALDAGNVERHEPLMIAGGAALAPGRALNFRYPGEGDSAILVRGEDGRFFAYGQKCPHLACPVYFEVDRGRLECPCHEGGFELETGHVLYGPPPRPLDVIELEMRDGELWAVGRRRPAHERSV